MDRNGIFIKLVDYNEAEKKEKEFLIHIIGIVLIKTIFKLTGNTDILLGQ